MSYQAMTVEKKDLARDRASTNKVLLINPPWNRIFGGASDYCPLGLLYIAAVLEEHGCEVVVYNADFERFKMPKPYDAMNTEYDEYLSILGDIDNPLWKDVGEIIAQQSPDVVGISVMSPKCGSSLNVSRLVKEFNPHTVVVWGGPHPTVLPDEVIENRDVDIVVRGEGEHTFLDVVQNLDRLDKVPGITYKNHSGVIHNPVRPLISHLDVLPFPARHLMLRNKDYHAEAFGHIIATRGCPYQCIFCASHEIWTRKVRYRSPHNVVEEIRQVNKTFGTRRFRFEDDSFTIDTKFVERVCDLLLSERLNVRWTTETRADLVTDGLIKKMKSAGCEEIVIGIESGDAETLKKIKKGITIEQIRGAAQIIKANKIKCNAFFMIGFPWESGKEIGETVSLMNELGLDYVYLNVATPWPGTELHSVCVSEGLISDNTDWSRFYHQRSAMHWTQNLTRDEGSRLLSEAQKVFEKHNTAKRRHVVLSDPLYIIRRVMRGRYHNPRHLWNLFRRFLWE